MPRVSTFFTSYSTWYVLQLGMSLLQRLKQPSPFTTDPACAAIRDAITGYGDPQLTVEDAEFREGWWYAVISH